MNLESNLKFQLKTAELIRVWQSFCSSHTDLYDLTCEEYLHLLESNIEMLEDTLTRKNLLLERIKLLDQTRENLLSDLLSLTEKNSSSINGLIQLIRENGNESEAKQLEGYNALLLDIIQKIQTQNKKNQVFLNKAILSLQDLRQSFTGKKNYKTYGANGVTRANISP